MERHLAAYVRTQRETSTDAAAVATLLAALAEAVERTRPLLEEGKREQVNHRLIQCQKVLIGLRSGLDLSVGAIAEQLQELYTFCERSLGEANMHLDPSALDPALTVIRNVRDAFQGIAFPDEGGKVS